MKLKDLLNGINYKVLQGDLDKEITILSSDSRKITENGVFVCIVGAVSDGHKYVKQVSDKGAAAVIVQEGSTYEAVSKDVTVILTENTRYALALMSASYYGNPDKELFTIGITGTKGKTTTTYMVKNVLKPAVLRRDL